MPVRMIACLLAVAMAVGIAAPAALASPATASLFDDGTPDPEPAIVATPLVLAPLARRAPSLIAAPPAGPHGRLHPASVFRPPRPFASR